MTHIQAFCQRTGRSISGTCAYTLDREVMAAWRRWMKAGPETEGAARKEYEAAQQVLNEYGDAWEADQARKEARP